MKLRSDDRVLFLAMPPETEMVNVSRILIRGVLVALGSTEEVDAARRSMAEFTNTMFLDASPDNIPWRDAYFTKIVVPGELAHIARHIAPELGRLLSPDGRIIHTSLDV